MTPGQEQSSAAAPFLLNDCLVEATANRIRRDGGEIRLEARMMALLVYLADRPGEVVTREALEREVWQGRYVSYDALTVCIRKLRKSLGDDPRRPRFIETIAKRGYRCIATVQVQVQAPAARPAPAAWRHPASGALAGAILLAVGAWALHTLPADSRDETAGDHELATLAVLPFTNLNQEVTQDYLSAGLTADITTAIADQAGLQVIALPAAGDTVAANDGRGDPGVRYLLRGTVQSTERRLRVNARLYDQNTGAQLWAERYDRALTDVFAVQDDIVGHIVDALQSKVGTAEKLRAARRYTVSLDAYDAFLRGQALFSQRTAEDNLLARTAYEQAVALDGNFARAYSALALTYTTEFRYGWSTATAPALQNAYRLARRAVEIDDQSPQAQWVLGHVHLYRHEFADARRAAQQAVNLNRNFADGYMALANALIYSGDAGAALPFIRQAMRLNPRYPAQYAEILGQAYYFLDRYQDAVATLDDATARNANLLSSYIFLAAALVGEGNLDDARWTVEQIRTLQPRLQTADLATLFPLENDERLAALQGQLRQVGW